MNKTFDWKTAEYPCFGKHRIAGIVCFSSYGCGHKIDDANDYSCDWFMDYFKPYTKPKEKEKLWYWEVKNHKGGWCIAQHRMSEKEAISTFPNTARKIEALSFIEKD